MSQKFKNNIYCWLLLVLFKHVHGQVDPFPPPPFPPPPPDSRPTPPPFIPDEPPLQPEPAGGVNFNPFGIRCACNDFPAASAGGASTTTGISATGGINRAEETCTRTPVDTCLFWRFLPRKNNWKCLRRKSLACLGEEERQNGCSPDVWRILISRRHYTDFKYCLDHEHPNNKTLNAPLPTVNLTALTYASGLGRTRMAKLLLDIGADVDFRSGDEGNTALHVASANGHEKTVGLLVNHNASVDALDFDGRTALWLAAYFDQGEVIKILADEGADLNLADFRSISPAQAAASRGNVEALKALVEKRANLEGEEGFRGPPFFVDYLSPFRWALAGNHTEAAMFLVESGAEFNQLDIYTASEVDNVKLVLFLLDRDPVSRTKESVQSLMESSARTRSINVLRHFAQDNGELGKLVDWKTILLVSAYEGFAGGIEVVMTYRKRNIGGNNDRSTLNRAMFIAMEGSSSVENKSETIKYLISIGAEESATSSERVCSSPSFFSLEAGLDVYPTLPSTLLMTAATEFSYEHYQAMIKLGVRENQVAPGSTLTAFDYASCCDNTELVRKKLASVKAADPASGEAQAFRVARMARQCGSKNALMAGLETLGLVECPREKWGEFLDKPYLAERPRDFCKRSQKRLPYTQEERQWLNYALTQ